MSLNIKKEHLYQFAKNTFPDIEPMEATNFEIDSDHPGRPRYVLSFKINSSEDLHEVLLTMMGYEPGEEEAEIDVRRVKIKSGVRVIDWRKFVFLSTKELQKLGIVEK